MKDQIYIHMIDGSDAWIPVGCEQLSENEFKIGQFEDFDPEDASVIPQFIPGDIVTRRMTKKGSENVWTAHILLEPSTHHDKKYIEFLYRIVTGNKLKGDLERAEYKEQIERTRNEIRNGVFHYPAIVNYVKGIETV
jgi:hypothetical protein